MEWVNIPKKIITDQPCEAEKDDDGHALNLKGLSHNFDKKLTVNNLLSNFMTELNSYCH